MFTCIYELGQKVLVEKSPQGQPVVCGCQTAVGCLKCAHALILLPTIDIMPYLAVCLEFFNSRSHFISTALDVT